MLLLQESLNLLLGKFGTLLGLLEVDSPNVLVLLKELVELAAVKGDALLVLRQRAHQEAALQALLVQLVRKLRFYLVRLLLKLV